MTHAVAPAGTATQTRRRLVEAATFGFAEHGVRTASLLEITRRAGQRNRGAVHYHFGSRTGMLVAVLEQGLPGLAERERALLALARARPATDLAAAVEAFVRPGVELAEPGGLGRAYLSVLAQLVEDADGLDDEVVAALLRLGGYGAYSLVEERMPPLPDDVRAERLALATAFVLRAIADRGRAADDVGAQRPSLGVRRFADNLVAMTTGMLGAPAEVD